MLSTQKKVYCALLINIRLITNIEEICLELLKKYLTIKVNYFSVVVEERGVELTLLPFTPFR